MKKALILFIILLLPLLIYVFFSYGEHRFVPLPVFYPLETSAQGDTIYHTIPSFQLVNQDGDTVTEELIEGKTYVADFFFTTCPTICPQMTQQMKRIQEKYYAVPDFLLLSHTVNPEKDSAEVLKQYAASWGANTKQWQFLTGNRESIYTLAVEGYKLAAAEDTQAPGGFIHSELFVLVDRNRRIRGYYDGTSPQEVDKLIEDIRLLYTEYNLKEAAEKKIIRKVHSIHE